MQHLVFRESYRPSLHQPLHQPQPWQILRLRLYSPGEEEGGAAAAVGSKAQPLPALQPIQLQQAGQAQVYRSGVDVSYLAGEGGRILDLGGKSL